VPLQLHLLAEPRHMEADHPQGREVRPVQAGGDLVEREAELPQRDDLLQAGDVGRRVQAVSRPRVQRRPEQADLVVAVQRPDRQPGPPRQLSHLQRLEPHGKASCRCNGTTSRNVRIKGEKSQKEKRSGRPGRNREVARSPGGCQDAVTVELAKPPDQQ
jgi:hypothetical protein